MIAAGNSGRLPVRALDRQLRDLDLLVTDPVGYAQVWLNAASDVASFLLEVMPDGTERVGTWISADDHWPERQSRLSALVDHLKANGHRAAVVKLLHVRGPVYRHREIN